MKTATPATARAINDRLALDLLIERGPLTAPQLRDLTGLSRPTVADLVERLSAAGLVESVGAAEQTPRGPNAKRGPHAKVYRLVAERAHVVGVDLRRTGFAADVADLSGQTVGTASRLFDPAAGEPDLLPMLTEAVARAAAGRRPAVVVIGAPGLVRPYSGELAGPDTVPGWRADLPSRLERALGIRVLLENEVNLAAVAEHRLGVGADRADFVLLWLDEGVGGAVVLNGRLRRGSSGGAGEVGWLRVEGGGFCDSVAPEVRDSLAPEEFAERIAKGAFAVATVLDPGLVVLGGGVGRDGGEELAALVEDRLAVKSPIVTEVRASTVEGNAVLLGAVLTGLDLVRDEVFGG